MATMRKIVGSRPDKAVHASETVMDERNYNIDAKRILNIRITIAAIPIVPPPPRPKKDEVLFCYRIDKDRVLTINGAITAHPSKSRSGSGNNER